MSTNGNSEGISSWQALELRATVFLHPASPIDDSELWSEIIGGIPEEENRRPGEGLVRQVGPLNGLTAVVQVTNKIRVDLLLQPSLPPAGSAPNENWPELEFSRAMGVAHERMRLWLFKQPQVARLAFGANLVQPANDWESCQRGLGHYLPGLDLVGSLDFFYQVNRPRSSRVVEGLRINRLCKWAVMTQVAGGISVGSDIGNPVQVRQISQRFASSLVFDINTAPEWSHQLPSDVLAYLFNELVVYGTEIADRGDIK